MQLHLALIYSHSLSARSSQFSALRPKCQRSSGAAYGMKICRICKCASSEKWDNKSSA